MGLDITRKLSLPWNAPLQHSAGLWAAKPPVEVYQDSLAAESAASPQSKASHVSSLPTVAPKQGSELDCAAYSAANDPENALTPSKKDNQIQDLQSMRRMGRQQKSPRSQEEQRMPFRSTQTHMTPQQKLPAQCAKAMGLDNPFGQFIYSDAGDSLGLCCTPDLPQCFLVSSHSSLHVQTDPSYLEPEWHAFADVAVQNNTFAANENLIPLQNMAMQAGALHWLARPGKEVLLQNL